MYDLPHVILCSMLAVLAGANSYASVYRFIQTRWHWLRLHTGLNWRRVPCYTALYTILRGIDTNALEQALREQATLLVKPHDTSGIRAIALDGKTLRGSFNHASQIPSLHWLSAFTHQDHLVLGQVSWRDGDKRHEITAAQQLIAELGLTHQLYTLDALHCQKNL